MLNFTKIIIEAKEKSGIALAHVLNELKDSPFSEKTLSQQWVKELRKTEEFHEEGWYAPPPNGIICTFGKEENKFERLSQPSFRPEYMWPKEENTYSAENMIAVYSSFVEKNTHIIGDFGLNLYQGNNSEVHEHIENVLKTTIEIAQHTKTGMAFKEIYNLAMECAVKIGFMNNIESTADKAGTNIGHTIPLSFKNDPTHQKMKDAKDFEDIREALRTGRIFLSGIEDQKIEETMAFTIEPRFSTEKMPNTWFHMTVIFDEGEKTITHGFDPVFDVFGMQGCQKILKTLPA